MTVVSDFSSVHFYDIKTCSYSKATHLVMRYETVYVNIWFYPVYSDRCWCDANHINIEIYRETLIHSISELAISECMNIAVPSLAVYYR